MTSLDQPVLGWGHPAWQKTLKGMGEDPMTVQRILKHKGNRVVTAKPDQPLLDITRLLTKEGIGAVVISADGRSVDGILSERDIVRTLAAHGPEALNAAASTVMTSKVNTCQGEDRIAEIMARMTQGRFRHFPVVEDGALVGMISIGDVVRVRMDEVEAEAEALRSFITQ